DRTVTGVQTCALPIWWGSGVSCAGRRARRGSARRAPEPHGGASAAGDALRPVDHRGVGGEELAGEHGGGGGAGGAQVVVDRAAEIGRGAGRERRWMRE